MDGTSKDEALTCSPGSTFASTTMDPCALGIAMQQKLQGNQTKLYPDEQETIRIFNDATTSVVFITNLSSRRDYFTLDMTEVPQGSGSGFVWDQQGHVVTNFHVVKGASDLRVTLGSQSTYPARVVGFDEDKDIAVVEIKAKPEETLRAIPLGSSDKLLVGQTVYAIGNPFGLDHTLTRGVISGLQREIVSGNTGRPIRGIIQTDASINPGNSGGPLLDSNGNLIGMNTAILSPSGSSAGVGFAIPVDTINTTVNQLLKYGRIVRPQLGIAIAPDQTVRRVGKRGVLVLQVPPGSPAAAAGLQPTRRNSYGEIVFGDIITQVEGQRVEGMNDLYRVLDDCKVGQQINLKVFRDGEGEVTVPITLGAYVRQFD